MYYRIYRTIQRGEISVPPEKINEIIQVVNQSIDISSKVDKETGKGLSTNDYTTEEKSKLAILDPQASNYVHPTNHPPSIITQDEDNRFISDVEKSNLGTAYSHSQSTHAPISAQINADITKPEIEAKLIGEIVTHTHPSSGGSDPWHVVKLSQDFVSSLATNANVPGFNFTPAPNKTYLIFGYFLLRTATATVGARPGVAWPLNITDATIRVEAANSLTTSALQLFGAMTTKNAASTGLATTNGSHWGSLDGIMITSGTTSGNFQITLASETAGTNVTMKAGSILMYREL